MLYLTGIHALNIPCALNTCGDWHASALRWEKMKFKESDDSIFGDYGIEQGHAIPCHDGVYNVANTIRAALDMLDDGYFSNAQGMNEDFICNPLYDEEVFAKILMLRHNRNWNEIDQFMGKEYKMKWINYKRGSVNQQKEKNFINSENTK